MSQSKDAVQLCALLVDETYGELASRIFTILLRRGRLPIHTLAQHTRLTRRQLQHGLVVLIQQNLIYYFEETPETIYYEANQGAAYGLVRSGKILDVVESRYGPLSRDVVQKLFLLGHTKVCDLAETYQLNKEPLTNGNGHGNGNAVVEANAQIQSLGHLDSILYNLLEAGLVEPVTELMFRSPDDIYNEVEKDILKNEFSGSTKGTKQKEMLKIQIRDKLGSLRRESQNWKGKGNKRKLDSTPLNGTNGSSKRRRLSNGSLAVNGNHAQGDAGLRLERDLVIRVNYEKCTVALRSLRLVELANSRIGETTSQIYAELLRLLEENIPRCRPDPRIDNTEDLSDGPTITTVELAAAMSTSINVGTGVGKVSGDRINTANLLQAQASAKRKLRVDFEAEVEGEASADEDESNDDAQALNGNGNIPEIDEESDSHGEDPFEDDVVARAPKRAKVTFQDKLPKPKEPEDRQNVMAQIKNHLLLLAADGCHFLRRCGSRGQGEWTVDFERVIDILQQSELDSIILENFDTTGHRLARMMRAAGKMDEKQLSTMALMKQKDVRTKLAEMQMAGMADIQEIPKDATRANNRTIFLWYFDSERVASTILRNTFKAMSRCFQRLEVEKRRASGILALTERSDVKDNTEAALTGEQLNMLREIRAKEEKLLGQIGRLDEMIGTFRDY